MVRLVSLKKSDQFKKVLSGRKQHTGCFSVFAVKNFIKREKHVLLISFIQKKKIGNAVKRNRIKRKLRAIVLKIAKKSGAINFNYTYIVFGKTRAYTEKYENLLSEMTKVLKKF
tara:strand:- start:348 stop:689 length:342 start_codon:yes stop_codon:yes gene_type:complete